MNKLALKASYFSQRGMLDKINFRICLVFMSVSDDVLIFRENLLSSLKQPRAA